MVAILSKAVSMPRGAAVLAAAVFVAIAPLHFAAAASPIEMRLWEESAPGAKGEDAKDVPTATVYVPDSSSPTAALVILPGGGYGHLADGHEGVEIAEWAQSMSMAGIVVRYRHRNRGYGHPAPMLDAQRAIRLTRAHAKDWNIDPAQVGVIGFSAGGHLATTVLTHFSEQSQRAVGVEPPSADDIDRQSSRPDFGIVCYPVVALDNACTHRGSQRNLLGSEPDPKMLKALSNETQVTKETPPCFVWHTAEDKVVPAENSLLFYQALIKAGTDSELHIFPEGRHGIGLAKQTPGAQAWPMLAKQWLTRRKILPSP